MPQGIATCVYRCLLRVASALVPRRDRARWRAARESALHAWGILADRGELIRRERSEAIRLCFTAFVAAVWTRFERQRVRAFGRGPSGVLAGLAVLFAVLGVGSGGFSGTRHWMNSLRLAIQAPEGQPLGPGQEGALARAFLLAFALVMGAILVAVGSRSLQWHGWRYSGFLIVKTAAVTVLVPLHWFEVQAAVSAYVATTEARMVISAVTVALLFLAGFGCALRWSFADQARRCPVCLQLLALPVTIGTWSSVFEPATTEFLCINGHGSLSVPELSEVEPDRWTTLDSSWRELFTS
jgi:hypothetical protein